MILKHLQELMADAATYGWEPVCACHAVWSQHIVNGHAEWEDTDVKLEFHMALVWSTVQRDNPRPQLPAAPQQLAARDMGSKPVTAKPGTKSCAMFKQVKCDTHICSYYLNEGALTPREILPMQNLQRGGIKLAGAGATDGTPPTA